MTGTSEELNLERTGASASSGRLDSIALSLRCASCKARLISVSCLNSRVTVETLSKDVERMLVTFSIEETASSIFLVTLFSTSAGEAPG